MNQNVLGSSWLIEELVYIYSFNIVTGFQGHEINRWRSGSQPRGVAS